MDKSFIINEIKSHLNIKTDSDLADFLGVKQPTISTWRKRNSIDYDLIITKCNNINGHWLLTGEGEMLKQPQGYTTEETPPPVVAEGQGSYGNNELHLKTIAMQADYIALQEKHIELYKEHLDVVNLLHLSKEKICKLRQIIQTHRDIASELNITEEKVAKIINKIDRVELVHLN